MQTTSQTHPPNNVRMLGNLSTQCQLRIFVQLTPGLQATPLFHQRQCQRSTLYPNSNHFEANKLWSLLKPAIQILEGVHNINLDLSMLTTRRGAYMLQRQDDVPHSLNRHLSPSVLSPLVQIFVVQTHTCPKLRPFPSYKTC